MYVFNIQILTLVVDIPKFKSMHYCTKLCGNFLNFQHEAVLEGLALGFELTVKVVLKKDLHFTESLQEIGNFISESFLKDSELKALHARDGYKNYVFDNLSNTESNGIYRKDRLYRFRVRSVDGDVIRRMKDVLCRFDNRNFVSVGAVIKEYNGISGDLIIEKLVTKNPIILRDVAKSNDDFDIIEFKKLVETNIEKKYNEFYGTDYRDVNWLRVIEVVSRKPIAIHYKGIKLLGMNYVLYVNTDEISQKFADFASFVGVGTKNSSLGAGFSNAVMYEYL